MPVISTSEVLSAARSLKNYKTANLEGVYNEFLKYGAEVNSLTLIQILNRKISAVTVVQRDNMLNP